MGVLGFHYGLEIALPRESGECHEVFRTVLLGQSAGFSVFLA